MDKKIVGLAGAMAVAMAPIAAQALPAAPSPSDVLQVKSYGDLLEPIPNARLVLKAVDATDASHRPASIEKVQYHHHHHHHHHHHVLPRPLRHLLPHRHYHHHHHHHHHY